MAEKPVTRQDTEEVIYDRSHWDLLHTLRMKADGLMQVLKEAGIVPYMHGSVARGDTEKDSDIDVILESVISSYKVELALTENGYSISSRSIVQATPSHSPKAHIYLDPEELTTVTFPLMPFRTLEWEFYKFGGLVNSNQLKEDLRIPGVTKRLTLVEPTPRGHIESAVEGREAEIAKILNVHIEIMRERIRVLKRRDHIGRTGVFLSYQLDQQEQIESAFRSLMQSRPEIKRRQRMKKFGS